MTRKFTRMPNLGSFIGQSIQWLFLGADAEKQHQKDVVVPKCSALWNPAYKQNPIAVLLFGTSLWEPRAEESRGDIVALVPLQQAFAHQPRL
jgi:hypothetical protein